MDWRRSQHKKVLFRKNTYPSYLNHSHEKKKLEPYQERRLAEAAKWSRPHLRKRYVHGSKIPTLSQLTRKRSQLLDSTMGMNKEDEERLVQEKEKLKNQRSKKLKEKNDYKKLQQGNKEFMKKKEKEKTDEKLSKLDALAWESVLYTFGNEDDEKETPANGSPEEVYFDAEGEACPPVGGHTAGALQQISSDEFFKHFKMEDFHLQEEQQEDGDDDNDEDENDKDNDHSEKESKKAYDNVNHAKD
ncbi:hypothetical protein RFI_15011, partial [Reticulomyxa filosa]